MKKNIVKSGQGLSMSSVIVLICFDISALPLAKPVPVLYLLQLQLQHIRASLAAAGDRRELQLFGISKLNQIKTNFKLLLSFFQNIDFLVYNWSSSTIYFIFPFTTKVVAALTSQVTSLNYTANLKEDLNHALAFWSVCLHCTFGKCTQSSHFPAIVMWSIQPPIPVTILRISGAS